MGPCPGAAAVAAVGAAGAGAADTGGGPAVACMGTAAGRGRGRVKAPTQIGRVGRSGWLSKEFSCGLELGARPICDGRGGAVFSLGAGFGVPLVYLPFYINRPRQLERQHPGPQRICGGVAGGRCHGEAPSAGEGLGLCRRRSTCVPTPPRTPPNHRRGPVRWAMLAGGPRRGTAIGAGSGQAQGFRVSRSLLFF